MPSITLDITPVNVLLMHLFNGNHADIEEWKEKAKNFDELGDAHIWRQTQEKAKKWESFGFDADINKIVDVKQYNEYEEKAKKLDELMREFPDADLAYFQILKRRSIMLDETKEKAKKFDEMRGNKSFPVALASKEMVEEWQEKAKKLDDLARWFEDFKKRYPQ